MPIKKLVVVPWNMGSHAAKALAQTLSEKLGYKVWRVSPERVKRRIPFVLKQGTSKLTQMERFKENGVSTPEFCTDFLVARGWLSDGAVVCRTQLQSSQGKGIVIADNVESLVDAPLYTRYFKKKKEFRVHVFNGSIIDVQEKRRRNGVEKGDTRIRNLANGYVFCRANIIEPDGLRELAIKATQALAYTLGAVDIAFNEHHNQLVVFEVNANPGLEGTTLENYSNAIINWYKEQVQ